MVTFDQKSKKLNGLCCSAYKFLREIETQANISCANVSTDYFESLTKNFAAEILDTFCPADGRSKAVCVTVEEKLKAVDLEAMAKEDGGKMAEEESASFVTAILKLVQTLT